VSPAIEFLWWEGCPSHEQALSDLRAAMRDVGLDPASIAVRQVGSEEAAAREGFVGSPTIRIDGHELQAPSGDDAVGLTCRVYRLRDGRYSPTPDPTDLREALAATKER
jgi:hypothetical protein